MTSEINHTAQVPDRTFAATSWLWPLPLEDNLRLIANWELPIRQVALLFYQTAPSLAYTGEDIPTLPGLSSHVHLPVDLPWDGGVGEVYSVVERLMDVAAPLEPWCGVLHPPDDPEQLRVFAKMWRKAAPGWDVLVENVSGQGLRRHWRAIEEYNIPLCLDVGHLMAFEQHWLPSLPGYWRRVALMHCYAPGEHVGSHSHLGLDMLTTPQALVLRQVFEQVGADVPVLFEVFSESDLRASLEKFYALHDEWSRQA